MWRGQVPRVAGCVCAAMLLAGTAEADIRFGPSAAAVTRSEAAAGNGASLRLSAARLAAHAAAAAPYRAPHVAPRTGAPAGLLRSRTEERPRPLASLYVGFAALQALDAHSTLRAVRAGGDEANPLIAPFADRPGLMLGVKAAAALTTIAFAEKLWRRNRTAAVVLMVAANAGYAIIVAHNYRQSRRGPTLP